MAAQNDSQGLKIAVAVSIALSVILLVASFFLYQNYDKEFALRKEAESKAASQTSAAAKAKKEFDDLRERAGYADFSSWDAVRDEITKDQQSLDDKITALAGEVGASLDAARQAGATDDELKTLQDQLTQVVGRLDVDPATGKVPSVRATLNDLYDVTSTQVRLSTSLALNNIRLRQSLGSANQVNNDKLNVQSVETQKANDQLNSEIGKFTGEVSRLQAALNDLQNTNDRIVAERDKLQGDLQSEKDSYEKNLADLRNAVAYYRTLTEKSEVVLDRPDGVVTYIDHTTGELRTNLTRSMGAKPQMMLTIFDKNSPGLPSDKPKARIQLIQVTEQDSLAKVVNQTRTNDPIRTGDLVYSPAFSPGEPERYALIGKIDLNRDGVDDRDDLKRLIQAAGGIVEYDLPPPGVGKESGELTPRTSWYVIDEREVLGRSKTSRSVKDEMVSEGDQGFMSRRTEVLKQARDFGVRPMPIQRLLSAFNYNFNMTIPGEIEARDNAAIRDLLNPRGMGAQRPAPEGGAEEPAPESDTPPANEEPVPNPGS